MRQALWIQLNEQEAKKLNRPVRGNGGFQTILRYLKSKRVDRHIVCINDPVMIERFVRYSTKYGEGGFQGRITSQTS